MTSYAGTGPQKVLLPWARHIACSMSLRGSYDIARGGGCRRWMVQVSPGLPSAWDSLPHPVSLSPPCALFVTSQLGVGKARPLGSRVWRALPSSNHGIDRRELVRGLCTWRY